MRFQGRAIDPVAFWSRYVDFPSGLRIAEEDTFAPKVQCPNPDHDTTKRHFQVNLRAPKVHCFAYCGISGSWEHAVCVIEGLYEKFQVDLQLCREAWDKHPHERSKLERAELQKRHRAAREARKIILRAAEGTATNGKTHRVRAKAKSTDVARKTVARSELEYKQFLPAAALEYLDHRGLSPDSVATWQLGWDSDELRLVIPAHDENGRLKFLIKRAVRPKDQPKYLYTEGFPKTALLFGLDKIDLGMVRSHGLGLVEGSIDSIVLHQHGLKIFGAILGTGISEQQRRIIARVRPPRIYLWFDRDSAGIRNIEIAAEKLRKYPLYICRFPKGKSDPGELSRKEAWRQYERAIPAGNFIRTNSLNVYRRRKEQSFG